jgi:tRNA A-37 threonylcarbamoyl transferase component Bud32
MMATNNDSQTAASPHACGHTRADTPRARAAALSCLDANQIAELLEGVLVGRARRRAEEHIDVCSPCRELVAGMATRLSLEGDALAWWRDADAWVSTMRSDGGASQHGLEPGDPFDHYEIKRMLGRGGMGEVYLAHDKKLERDVAIKMVRLLHANTTMAKERFMTEARMTARLNHPHIVTVHAVGEHDGRPYLALEYVPGATMRHWMREHSSAGIDNDGLRIVLAIAEALDEAHAHGILHRDLKPENVLIDPRGRVRVVDFGLALPMDRQLDEDSTRDAVFTGVVGTPRYMAPEQWLDAAQGPTVDVWALGVMLFELITGGGHPSGVTCAADASRVRLDVIAATADVSHLPDDLDVPSSLRQLVDNCLARRPPDRPSAAHIVSVLRALLDDDVTRARRAPRHGWATTLLGVLAGGAAVWALSGALTPEPPVSALAPALGDVVTVAAAEPQPGLPPAAVAQPEATLAAAPAASTSSVKVMPAHRAPRVPVTTATSKPNVPTDPLDHW